MVQHCRVLLFGSSEGFTLECDPGQTHFQLRAKLILRQVAFNPISFFAFGIEYDYSRCPRGVKTMEISRVFFDMCFERDEVVVDKRSSLFIAVRLGFQPNASASSGRGTEVDEQRLLIGLGLRERRVGICQPLN